MYDFELVLTSFKARLMNKDDYLCVTAAVKYSYVYLFAYFTHLVYFYIATWTSGIQVFRIYIGGQILMTFHLIFLSGRSRFVCIDLWVI